MKRSHRFPATALRLFTCVLLLAALLSQTVLAASYICLINANTKVYQTASTSAKSIKVSKNMQVTATRIGTKWATVQNKGVTAYIPVQYLTLKTRVKGYMASAGYVYKTASTATALGKLSKGSAVYIVGWQGNYYRVQNKSASIEGYVKKSLVTDTKPAADTSSSSKVTTLIKGAKSLLGRPYVYGASGPSTFDCSGFVRFCYGKVGVSISGNAKSIGYTSRFKRVTKVSALQQGDIVCFDTVSDSDLSDHVGIYIGSGQFIHASSAGGKVITSTLSSGYYNQKFSWGLRVFG